MFHLGMPTKNVKRNNYKKGSIRHFTLWNCLNLIYSVQNNIVISIDFFWLSYTEKGAVLTGPPSM